MNITDLITNFPVYSIHKTYLENKILNLQSRAKSSLNINRHLGLPKLRSKKSLFYTASCNSNNSTSKNINQNTNNDSLNNSNDEVITKIINASSEDNIPLTEKIFTINLKQKKKFYYDKKFAKFRGFTAFAFKNDDKYNYDKLDIFINKEINHTHNKNSKLSLAHFMAIHHGINGDDISSIMKTQLREHLFNANNTYIDNPVQALVDAYHNAEMNVYKAVSTNSECNCSSISLFILHNKVYIANTGNAKCVVSCNTNENMPYYNITRINNYSNNTQSSYISFTDLTPKNNSPSNHKHSFKPIAVSPYNSSSSNKKTHFTLTPDITEVTISNSIYFFIVINDCLSKMLSIKQLMLIIYQTMLVSLDTNVAYKQMCSNVIDAICLEVLKREGNDTLSVLFLPLEQFVNLYNKSHRNDIQFMISRIQNESELYEQMFPQCVVHEYLANGMNYMFGHIRQTNSHVSNLQTNVNSPFLDERTIREHQHQQYANVKMFEKYVKNECVSGNRQSHVEKSSSKSEKKENCRKNKKKALFCGCFA